MIRRTTAVFLVLAAGACTRTPAPEAGELRVIPLAGSVSLIDGGETSLINEATTIDAGVSILTELGGRAEVELPGQRSMELAPQTELRVDDRLSEVAGGSVLVRAGSPVMLRAGGADIEASDAIFRVDKGASVLLATYRGAATVLGSGVQPVTALRQAAVLQGGEIPLGVEALQVRQNDPWDTELLGRSIDLGLQLLNYERGLTRQLPSGREASAVSRVLDGQFSQRAIRSAIAELGSAARTVVAAVVAQEAARLDGGSSRHILAQILGLQSLGANWIVIVAEWGLPAAAAALTQNLRDLATAISELVAPPPAPALTTAAQGTVGPQGSGPSGADGPSGGGPPPPGGGGPGPDNGSTPPPDPPPADEPPESSQPPSEQCGSTVDCAVEDILDTPRSLPV